MAEASEAVEAMEAVEASRLGDCGAAVACAERAARVLNSSGPGSAGSPSRYVSLSGWSPDKDTNADSTCPGRIVLVAHAHPDSACRAGTGNAYVLTELPEQGNELMPPQGSSALRGGSGGHGWQPVE